MTIHCIKSLASRREGASTKTLMSFYGLMNPQNLCYCCLNFFFLFISLSLLVYRSFLRCNAAAAAATLLMLGSSFIHTFRHGLCGQLVGSASRALLAFLQDSHQEASVVLSKWFCFSLARFPVTAHKNSTVAYQKFKTHRITRNE